MTSEATVPPAVVTSSPATDARDVRCAGAWTVRTIADVEPRLARVPWPSEGEVAIDGSGVSLLDTSGAWLLHRTVRELAAAGVQRRASSGLRPEFASLLELIASREIPLASPAPRRRAGSSAWAGTRGRRPPAAPATSRSSARASIALLRALRAAAPAALAADPAQRADARASRRCRSPACCRS